LVLVHNKMRPYLRNLIINFGVPIINNIKVGDSLLVVLKERKQYQQSTRSSGPPTNQSLELESAGTVD